MLFALLENMGLVIRSLCPGLPGVSPFPLLPGAVGLGHAQVTCVWVSGPVLWSSKRRKPVGSA